MARIKHDFGTLTLVMIPVAIAMNIAVGQLIYSLKIPLYLDSIASEYNFPRAAMLCTVSARIPANGPNPTTMMAITAQINGSMERTIFNRVRVR